MLNFSRHLYISKYSNLFTERGLQGSLVDKYYKSYNTAPLLLIILVNCTSDFLISSHQGLSSGPQFYSFHKDFFSFSWIHFHFINFCLCFIFVLFYLLFRYFKVSSRYIGWFLIFLLHQYNHLKLFSSEHSNSCVPQVFMPCFTAIFTYFANFLWFLTKPTG